MKNFKYESDQYGSSDETEKQSSRRNTMRIAVLMGNFK